MTDRQPTVEISKPSRPKAHKPLMPRVMAKVKHDPDTGCWTWTGYLMAKGYACICWRGRNWLVHRAVYTKLVGPIPEGLQIDHLCENKACCNPMHLEPVTNYENGIRTGTNFTANALKTHCPHGHEYTPENTLMRPQSMGRPGWGRFCKTCQSERYQRSKERQSA